MNKAKIAAASPWLDERAYEAIFTEHYPALYAILFRLAGDPLEADDLAAETFWRLWQNPPPREENVGGWLYRVATRVGYNALRSNRRREQYETQSGWEASPGSNPASDVEQRLERAAVRAVLRSMPLRDVQVLVMRHSGMAYKEIAAVLEVPVTSVGTLLARAEAKFESLYRKGDAHAPK